MFTIEERERVRNHILEMAKADPRVTAGALVGSLAGGTEDAWSDIDITFGIAAGISIETILDEWTEALIRDFGILHHWDLRSGPSIYRVFLLPSSLEVDLSVTPQPEFGARAPRFKALFGDYRQIEPPPPPTARYRIGLAWHHVLHARSYIERGKLWGAEYWISSLRDETLALACLRLGEETADARGFHRLPATLTEPMAETLVRSLDEAELRRALRVAIAYFLNEVEVWDPDLYALLKPTLQEVGAQ